MASSQIIASLLDSARWANFRAECAAHLARRATPTVRHPSAPRSGS